MRILKIHIEMWFEVVHSYNQLVNTQPGRNHQNELHEKHFIGKSDYLVVRSDNSDRRSWLRNAPVCSLLANHHIAHVGIMRARFPFEVTRTDLSGTYMMACFEGEGKVLVDGNWHTLGAGQACLQPPFVLNSLQCDRGKPWCFCWVRYLEPRESIPIVTEKSPVVGSYGHAPLKAAIEGLSFETENSNSPGALGQWIDLIHHYVLQFAQPRKYDDRLWKIWVEVESRLDRKWTLCELASLGHVSEEHLRRLCRRYHGRSPMQHLTFLRLQRARVLLSSTDDKIETIARAVGYDAQYTFSNLYKRWFGLRPSDCR
ncbi:MAG: helix-turn-helix transcriptional regulator [Opitutales bacterium]|nr:helix-turn-helix transcriptional regulator [Opitutales bacterium]